MENRKHGRPFLAALMVLLVCLGLPSCAATTVYIERTVYAPRLSSAAERTPVTMTVTVSREITVVQGVTKTVTVAPAVYTPIFERPAPEIPHPYILHLQHSGLDLYDDGIPVCFLCHPMPPEHELWLYDAEICETCHRVAANPTITPRG